MCKYSYICSGNGRHLKVLIDVHPLQRKRVRWEADEKLLRVESEPVDSKAGSTSQCSPDVNTFTHSLSKRSFNLMWTEISTHKRTYILWFHLYEEPRVIKFIEAEKKSGYHQGLQEEGERRVQAEWVRASALQDEKDLGMDSGNCCTTVQMCLMPLNHILQNSKFRSSLVAQWVATAQRVVTQHCYCSGISCCCSSGLVPGPGSSTCHRHAKKTKPNQNQNKTKQGGLMLYPFYPTNLNFLIFKEILLHSNFI